MSSSDSTKSLLKEIEELKIYKNLIFQTGDELKKLRERNQISQNKLAKGINVSQPFIARIEKGDVDPSISTLKKILEFILETQKSEMKAIDITTYPVDFVRKNQLMQEAVNILDKKGYSQLIVLDDRSEKIIGSISVKKISETLTEKGRSFLKERIEKHYEKPFPTIHLDEPLEIVEFLLRYNDAVVIVDEEGSLTGIITHADLLKSEKKHKS